MKPRSLTVVVPLLFLAAARAEEPKPLPPELRWVPADSVGFVHVRVGEILDSRAGKAVLAFLKTADARMLEELEHEFGIPIEQIDRLTLVLPDIEADTRGPGVILRLTTREPYDRAKVVAALRLQDRPDRPKGLGGGKKLFTRGFDRYERDYVHLTDAKTVTHLFGDGAAALLGKLLEGETSGRLSPALEAAAKGDQFVAAIDANRLRILPDRSLTEEFGPLLEAGLAMIRGKLTDGGAELHFRAAFQNEAHARAGRQTLMRFQDELLRDLSRSLQAGGEQEKTRRMFWEPLVNAIKGARFELDGGVATGTTSLAAKELVEFMEKDGGRAVAAEADRRKSENYLRQIALAMHNYESANGFLPTQSIKDKDGKPLLSWRVTILPYIEEDALHREFHLDEPWDSEHNKKLIARLPKLYRVPGKKYAEEGKTGYLVPVGPNTIFPADATRGLTLARITSADGTSNTIFTVQANDESAVIWSKPDDLVVDAKDPLKGLVRSTPEGFLVGMGDGVVKLVSPRINPKQLLAGFDWRDGKFPDFNDVISDKK